jgi:hypothetical protein
MVSCGFLLKRRETKNDHKALSPHGRELTTASVFGVKTGAGGA